MGEQMSGAGTDPAPAALWARVRERYENGIEPVTAIAADAGISRQALSSRARAEGWKLRSAPQHAKPQGTRGAELGAGVVMAEVQSEHWLSRSWRPLLMLLLMGFLVLAGFVLPLADAIAGRTLPFAPRWQALPQGFWDFLAVGMGGYIGGRSLEKVAGAVASMKATDGRTAGLPFMRRSDRMD